MQITLSNFQKEEYELRLKQKEEQIRVLGKQCIGLTTQVQTLQTTLAATQHKLAKAKQVSRDVASLQAEFKLYKQSLPCSDEQALRHRLAEEQQDHYKTKAMLLQILESNPRASHSFARVSANDV